MFIECPKCASKYKVDKTPAFEKATKLKCSECGVVFEKETVIMELPARNKVEKSIEKAEVKTHPDIELPDLHVHADIENSPFLPEEFKPVTKKGKKRTPGWVILLAAVLILLGCGYFFCQTPAFRAVKNGINQFVGDMLPEMPNFRPEPPKEAPDADETPVNNTISTPFVQEDDSLGVPFDPKKADVATSEKLKVRGISFKKDDTSVPSVYWVEGMIFNMSDKTAHVSSLILSYYDMNGALIAEETISLPPHFLEGYRALSFKEKAPFIKNTHKIEGTF
ncbi:MAG: zinc-ribbon domain-containing protein [Lactobacillales bacterium]|jgi:predicted Zn finger-like uncharacterized protein|nr:zinc-ribbon domain-containing protein [Lactobacillales bacterium]